MIEEPPPARLLLIPGFSQRAGVWDAVVGGLSTRSAATPLEVPTNLSWADTVAALARAGHGVWAGYSMGGRLALQLALDYPAAVQRLVLISASAGIADPTRRREREQADHVLADRIEHLGLEVFLDDWLAQPLFAGLDADEGRRHRLGDPQVVADQLRLLGQGAQEPLWGRLDELAIPVTVVAGGRDTAYATIARAMVEAMGASAETMIVPGAGHALLQERPEAVSGILTDVSHRG